MKYFKARLLLLQAETVYMLILKVIDFLCNWHTFTHMKTSTHRPLPTLFVFYAYLTELNTMRPSLTQHKLFLLWKFSSVHKIRENYVMNIPLLISYFNNCQHRVSFISSVFPSTGLFSCKLQI